MPKNMYRYTRYAKQTTSLWLGPAQTNVISSNKNHALVRSSHNSSASRIFVWYSNLYIFLNTLTITMLEV